jgi:hypothetical protein
MTDSHTSDDRNRLLVGVMIAVSVWGGTLALGAFLFGTDPTTGEVTFAPSVIRGGIVAGCVAIFVGGWALLLRRRRGST